MVTDPKPRIGVYLDTLAATREANEPERLASIIIVVDRDSGQVGMVSSTGSLMESMFMLSQVASKLKELFP